MIHSKPAPTLHPIHELIANRWSTLSFSDRPLSETQIQSLLEAARWAPSSYNEQPWSYVIGLCGDRAYADLSECLMEGNAWARTAPVLMLSVARNFFGNSHKPNRHALSDVGAANAFMVLQATAMDLESHQMAGFDVVKARQLFGIGEGYEPMSILAFGAPGSPESLEGKLREREDAPRTRKPFSTMIWPTA